MKPKQQFFQVGQTYTCRRGTYKVLVVDSKQDRMLVKFGDAVPEALRDLHMQERIVRNVEAEKRIAEQQQSQKRREPASAFREGSAASASARPKGSGARLDYFTLGFFGVRGRLSANVAHKAEQTFARMYATYTGEDPADSAEGYTLLSAGVAKWGFDFRLSFVASDAELDGLRLWMPATISTYRRSKHDRYVTDNALGFDLLTSGFTLGVQDLERIRRHVPAGYRAEFERGVMFALSGALSESA
jgi:hypothetical protein